MPKMCFAFLSNKNAEANPLCPQGLHICVFLLVTKAFQRCRVGFVATLKIVACPTMAQDKSEMKYING